MTGQLLPETGVIINVKNVSLAVVMWSECCIFAEDRLHPACADEFADNL